MRKSAAILPIRIYDNLFNQNRFNCNCEEENSCGSKLVFPNSDLPMFQFTRPASLTAPSILYLKSTCDDVLRSPISGAITQRFQKQIPRGADIFLEPQASSFYENYPPEVTLVNDDPLAVSPITADFTTIDCGNLVPKPLPPNYEYDDEFALQPNFSFFIDSDTQRYVFKIIVERFNSPTNSLQIQIYNGGLSGILLQTITAAGEYEIEFVSSANDITVCFLGFIDGDYFAISYMQAQNLDYTTIGSNSYELDETKLKVTPTGPTDIITYCGDNANYNIAPGDYYYVIISGDNTYFSEIFSIKPIKELENYYTVKWYHSCNINGAVFYAESVLNCVFYNTLYLDAALFNPEYETVEDDTENGLGDNIPTNKRWQKSITLDIIQSPQFLTDALSSIFIHDNVYIKEPLNINQDIANEFYQVLNVTNEITDLPGNCYQYVKLKLLLEDRFTGRNCCNNSNVITCPPTVQYTGANTCGTYKIMANGDSADGLLDCSTNELVPVLDSDIIYNTTDGFYYSFTLLSGIYVYRKYPSIIGIDDDGIEVRVQGKVLPYTFATLQYNADGAGYVDGQTIQAGADGNFKLYTPLTATSLSVKVKMSSYGCDNIKTTPVWDYY